jgi:GNAT superfamily N-acetyltransferase
MSKQEYKVRNARVEEFVEIGKLMVKVYSQLEGFPKESEQPDYYKMLANVGELTKKPDTELLVAVSPEGQIAGCVVYFSDMQYYGSGGIATKEQNASGFRLLAVNPSTRGHGIGKLLTNECIRKAKDKNHFHVVIHTTKAMQGELPVFGFRLTL